MTVKEMLRHISVSCSELYPEEEARAIAGILVEDVYGLSRTDIIISPCREIAPTPELDRMVGELKAGRPVQYVVGYTEFCALRFRLREGVLIPRPETEELVLWVIDTMQGVDGGSVLDIGTGSGCIAVALKSALPGLSVSAVDRSAEALEIAAGNAVSNHCTVNFSACDILRETPAGRFDCIVSNPPYVLLSEKALMRPNVLEYEPGMALFVDDSDPLLFYRTIATKALGMLLPGGYLFFEINEKFGRETCELLSALGFSSVELRRDIFDRDRMVRAVRP